MKKLLITLLKVAISVAIIAYLIWSSTRGNQNANAFRNLVNFPKNWWMLAAAFACCLGATLITFVRWWYLVRALGVPFRLADSIRISFWGYLFNLAPLGIVGGDIIKTVILGHEHPAYRAKALASVLVDRVIGLYILFVVGTAAILLTGFYRIDQTDIHWICNLAFIVTAVSTVGLVVVMGPDLSNGRILQIVGRIPRVGKPLVNVIEAVRLYNAKPVVLIVSCTVSVAVHCLFATCCYLIACGLPGNHHSLAMHFVMIPLSSATSAIPLPMGPFELVLDKLYQWVPIAGPAIAALQGLVVALAYRVMTLLLAACGTPYYFGNRREMAEVMHEAEEEGGEAIGERQ